MSTHPTARESHELHEQNRIDAARAARVVRDMADLEQDVRVRERRRVLARVAGVFVQGPEKPPHHFLFAVPRELVSPRRPMDKPDLPGHEDIGGFGKGFLC